ncbi:MAG: pantoate--beta-alanine ligase [Actinomycetota bacterium]|nr:pantoate--beta-alanine ligase [Actinomycetota bacterium]
MKTVSTRGELAAARVQLPGRVAVVMTMGALHDGHVELVKRARAEADSVVVTIFLNPLQFAAGEDLDRYPRRLDADLPLCEEAGADLVFTPLPAEVYPTEPVVRVSAGAIGDVFEGASRPGHFDGVVTVVLKLLHLVNPDIAYFGQKDAQQLACIRRMVRDLDVPVEIVAVPTVRDADGLALSSRNEYLTAEQRAHALVLARALATRDVARGRAMVEAEPGVDLDYFERVDSDTFDTTPDGNLLVVAARVGTTRLIDNLLLQEAAA